MIPSKGGREIGPELRAYAATASPGESIVELGTWLGAGTVELSSGAPAGVEVHTYDRFRGSAGNPVGQVVENLQGCKNVWAHSGEITNAVWKGGSIAVHVDDACKRSPTFERALEIFSPFWRPGTILVLMDYFWSKRHPNEENAQAQPRFIERNVDRFRTIKLWAGKSCAAFEYLGGQLSVRA